MDVYYSQTKGSMDFIADSYLLRELLCWCDFVEERTKILIDVEILILNYKIIYKYNHTFQKQIIIFHFELSYVISYYWNRCTFKEVTDLFM